MTPPGGSSPTPSGGGFQGSNYGYTSGGATPGVSDTIDKFSFTSDSNATDVGDLFEARLGGSGQQY